jgi:tetratricopeptide (TPR) repeat protein
MQSPLESPTARNHRPLLRTLALAAALLALQPAHAAPLDDASQAFKSGQHAKALELVDKHLAGQPKDAQGRFLKGLILTGLNKQAEAIVVFRKLTEDYPELPEPYNNLAVIYAQQKQYDKARDALEQAIRTHPAYATAHENLGDIYSRLASQAYGKALSIDSSNASAQTKLAMINDLVGGSKAPAAVAPAKAPAPTVLASAKPAEPPKPEPVAVAPAPAKPAVPESKPAEPTPATAPTPAPAKAGNPEGEITAVVDAWLAAWSKKDVKAYLAHYAQDFETPRGLSRKDWETERAQRVGKPGQIEVGRDKLAIKAEGADKATVRFRQNYHSASFKSSSGKTLVLIRRDGKWLILKEQTG